VFCQGTKQAVLPVTGENLTWYTAPGSTGSASQPVVNTQTAGDGQSFSVTQTVRGCTSAAAQVTVHIQEAIALHLGPDQMICNEETALLQADLTAAQYRWNTGDTTPYLAVKASGNYSLTVIDGACQATDEVRVLVQDCGCVRMPTAFTPNSDGSNDRLSPLLRCPDATYTFLIFDRWGNEVFSGQTGNEGWDGTVHGQPCPGGVYIYLVTYRQPGVFERPRQVTGNVLLLR
jgi:gliding motility-associated-like protein